MRFQGVSAYELMELMKSNKGTHIFLDVRPAEEYEEDRIEETISMPLENLKGSIDEIPKDKSLILISNTGARAYEAAIILQVHGYKDVRVLEGGLKMWPFKISHD